jgi:hypothetical protein
MNELIRIENDKAILKEEMIANILDIESKIKELTDVYDTYKKMIQEEMEKRNVIKIVDEITGLSISYVAAQENLEKFNKTRLRDNYPDIYDECIDMNGKRAAYITIRK